MIEPPNQNPRTPPTSDKTSFRLFMVKKYLVNSDNCNDLFIFLRFSSPYLESNLECKKHSK